MKFQRTELARIIAEKLAAAGMTPQAAALEADRRLLLAVAGGAASLAGGEIVLAGAVSNAVVARHGECHAGSN
jgi:hypothetical protein